MVTSHNDGQDFVALSPDDCEALKGIASGAIVTASEAQLGNLQSLRLIYHNGLGMALTSRGWDIVDIC